MPRVSRYLFSLLALGLVLFGCTDEGRRTGFTDFQVGYPFFCNEAYDFGAQSITRPYIITFPVINVGNGTITEISEFSLQSPFQFVGGSFPGTGGTCTGQMASGDTCTMVVQFAPTELTSYSYDATVRYKTMGATRTVTCTLTGSGRRPSGQLDTSFHTDGISTATFPGGSDSVYALSIQTDGRPFLAGGSSNFALARFDTRGALDTTFHTDGKATTATGGGAISSLVQTDGKLVVAGVFTNTNEDYGVARYRTDGSLDTSFHTDGIVTATFQNGSEIVSDMIVQDDGRIVLGGNATIAADDQMGLMRFMTGGALDTSFHTDGKAEVSYTVTSSDSLSGLALQSNGSIVVGGYTMDTAIELAVARVMTNGRLDTTFSTDGRATTTFQNDTNTPGKIALDTNGSVVMSASFPDGGSVYHYGVVRWSSNGVLDSSFHTDGKVDTTPDALLATDAAAIVADAIAIQTNGRIILGGTFPVFPIFNFAMLRWFTDGSLDTSFGSGGLAHTSLGANDVIYGAVAVQGEFVYRAGRHVQGADSIFGIARFWQ